MRQLELDLGRVPGTLTLPDKSSARGMPGVILVHGSGPQDRDMTFGPSRPFRDIAHGLAARGVATLRYDKHSYVERRRMHHDDNFTIDDETVVDAVAAARLLRARPEVGATFALGHSLGGRAIPRIAARDPELRGFIIMAGSCTDVVESLKRQVAHLEHGGDPRSRFEHVKLRAQLERASQLVPNKRMSAAHLPFGLPRSYWLDLREHPPGVALRTERRPMLVLHADRDHRVDQADFEGWRQALRGHPAATFRRYPDLDHFFLSEERVAEGVIADIASWIDRTAG